MRKGLLTELIETFERAKDNGLDHLDAPVYEDECKRLDTLRDEVLGLLREGDRLRRRADGPPSTPRKPAGPTLADMEREGMLMGGPPGRARR